MTEMSVPARLRWVNALPQARKEVECLACGSRRLASFPEGRDPGECPGCGYLGWSFPASLSELERRILHRQLGSRHEAALRLA
jgi:hypothetical protein